MDTIFDALKAPLFTQRVLEAQPLCDVVHSVDSVLQTVRSKNYKLTGDSLKSPEKEAVEFYLLNHLFGELRRQVPAHKPLAGWQAELARQYVQQSSLAAARMFVYLLLICTRESRHVQSSDNLQHGMVENFGQKAVDLLFNIHGSSSDVAVEKFLMYGKNNEDTALGQWTGLLVYVFDHGMFSSGFGGTPWANIARCLHSYVVGEASAEMMLDTAFTLAHNNGPIFNKGMTYAKYDSSRFIHLLDVQRSGQIPQLVLESHPDFRYYTDPFKDMALGAVTALGMDINRYVDWYLVEALGAVENYSSYKKAQDETYGPNAKAMSAQAIQAAKALLDQEIQVQSQAELDESDYLQIMPGVSVKKYQPVRETA